MSIYCTRGQHHRCEQCECGCHPEEENVTFTLPVVEDVEASEEE